MVRGGPANRAVKRAKIFAVTKVKCYKLEGNFNILISSLGISWTSEKLLQSGRTSCSQGTAVCLHWEETEEKRYEKSI